MPVANDGENRGVRVLSGAHPPTNLEHKFVELVFLFLFSVHSLTRGSPYTSLNRKPYGLTVDQPHYKIRKQ
jgi:hypothetical protein